MASLRAASAKFEAEQPTKATDSVVLPEPWRHLVPPHLCQGLPIISLPVPPGAAYRPSPHREGPSDARTP